MNGPRQFGRQVSEGVRPTFLDADGESRLNGRSRQQTPSSTGDGASSTVGTGAKKKGNYGAHYETQIRDCVKEFADAQIQLVVNLMLTLVRHIESCLCSELQREEMTRQMNFSNIQMQARINQFTPATPASQATPPAHTPTTGASAAAEPVALTLKNLMSLSGVTGAAKSQDLQSLARSARTLSGMSVDSQASSIPPQPVPTQAGVQFETQVRQILNGVEDDQLRHAVGLLITLMRHVEACIHKEIRREAAARQQSVTSLRMLLRCGVPGASSQGRPMDSLSDSDTLSEVVSGKFSEKSSRGITPPAPMRAITPPALEAATAPDALLVRSRARYGQSATVDVLPSMTFNGGNHCKSSMPMWMRLNSASSSGPQDSFHRQTSRSAPPAMSRLQSLLEEQELSSDLESFKRGVSEFSSFTADFGKQITPFSLGSMSVGDLPSSSSFTRAVSDGPATARLRGRQWPAKVTAKVTEEEEVFEVPARSASNPRSNSGPPSSDNSSRVGCIADLGSGKSMRKSSTSFVQSPSRSRSPVLPRSPQAPTGSEGEPKFRRKLRPNPG